MHCFFAFLCDKIEPNRTVFQNEMIWIDLAKSRLDSNLKSWILITSVFCFMYRHFEFNPNPQFQPRDGLFYVLS